jgi:iron-sulfur cluster assembly accessory protein
MNPTLTPAAEKFIRRMLRFSAGAGGFRLTVTPGGCSGLSAEFDVEAAPRAGDATLTFGDINLYLPAESRILLQDVTIDFSETPTSSGFKFHDPKAEPCGCATDKAAGKPAGLHQLGEF